jgi:alginate O-acetyltransferase complex protein AlgI
MLFIFIFIEWLGREQKYAIEKTGMKFSKVVRWSFYYAIILSILYFSGTNQEFIYFQF